MRIMLLDTGKEWGGGTNSLFELLKRINRQQFDITPVFYYNYGKGETSDLRSELAAIGYTLRQLTPVHRPCWATFLKALVRGVLAFWPRLKRRLLFQIECHWRIRPMARQLARLLREGKFDLLYMNNQPSSNLEGFLAAEISGVPVVQHCRIDPSLRPEEVTVVNRIARTLICVSEGVRESLLAQGVLPQRCQVVLNGIDSSQPLPVPCQLPELAANRLVIGAIGSLIKRKANHHLLGALARLSPETRRKLVIVFVGEGPEKASLINLAHQLGLSQHVLFVGFQSKPLPWLAAFDILVLASAKEGLPRVILEAMLLGKPVVSSCVTGSRELVVDGENGVLFPYGDECALAAALSRLLEDAALRTRMGIAGRQWVSQNYTIERYVEGVERELLAAVQ